MKQKEVIELSTPELRDRIAEQEHLLNQMKMTHSVNPLDNPMKIRHTRRNIARLLTELKKRVDKNSENNKK